MWSHARYDLGLTEEEWEALTLCELAALSERHRQRLQREAVGVGAIWAMLANQGRKKGEKPYQPADLFPVLAPPRKRRKNRDEILADVAAWKAAHQAMRRR